MHVTEKRSCPQPKAEDVCADQKSEEVQVKKQEQGCSCCHTINLVLQLREGEVKKEKKPEPALPPFSTAPDMNKLRKASVRIKELEAELKSKKGKKFYWFLIICSFILGMAAAESYRIQQMRVNNWKICKDTNEDIQIKKPEEKRSSLEVTTPNSSSDNSNYQLSDSDKKPVFSPNDEGDLLSPCFKEEEKFKLILKEHSDCIEKNSSMSRKFDQCGRNLRASEDYVKSLSRELDKLKAEPRPFKRMQRKASTYKMKLSFHDRQAWNGNQDVYSLCINDRDPKGDIFVCEQRLTLVMNDNQPKRSENKRGPFAYVSEIRFENAAAEERLLYSSFKLKNLKDFVRQDWFVQRFYR